MPKIQGSDFVDILFSTSSDDEINTGGGNDVILGSLGADTVFGGEGFDTISYAALFSPMTLSAFGRISHQATSALTQLLSIERIIASSSSNDLIDAALADQFQANVVIDLAAGTIFVPLASQSINVSGFENVTSTNQDDSVIGNSLANFFDLRGGNDTGGGGMGNDVILGGGGNDSLFGGMGEDRLTGGLGADVLKGGLGIDTFQYLNTKDSCLETGLDTITDFQANEVIDLTAIDPFSYTAANESFSWLGLLQGALRAPQAGTAGYQLSPNGIKLFAYVGETSANIDALEINITGISFMSAFNILL